MYIVLLSIAFYFVKSLSHQSLPDYTVAVGVTLLGAFHIVSRFRKQHRKQSWRLLRSYFQHRGIKKREKSKGGTIFLLLLMLIACVAILWVLWALGGIFALILGIVLGVGILSLILRDS